MRDEKGKSVPVLQEFQAETMMAPFTPEKPLVTGKMPIYQNGEALSTLDFMTEREDYLSRFTQHNQGEMPVHCDAGFAGEPYEAQGWAPLYTNPTRLPESASSTNPLAQWTYLSFSDLLALNHGLAAPMCGDQTSYDFSSYMDFQSPLIAPMPVNLGSNLRTEILQKNAVTNGSSPVTIPNAVSDGIIPVFAPETPEQSKRLQDNSASRETICSAYKHPDNQNGEDSQMSVVDDLMGVKGTQSATDSTVLDSYDPNKGGNSDLDQNKTSQQKPRRKKHRPKVIKADKPKQTPKERKSTPTDANETPRQKRKYVRKNKTVLPSTTPPESGAEALDSTIPDPAVKKSCRKALNFELEDQEKEKKEIDTNETPRQKRKYVPKKKADTTSTESGTEALEYKIPDPDLKTCRKDLNFDLEDQEKEKKQIDANETPRQKRKYVRKKKANTTSPESGTEALEYKIPDPALKTCRKDLNFDLEDQETENNFSHRFTNPPISEQITENLYPRKGKDVITEALQEIGAEAQSTPHPDQKGNSTEAIHPRELFARGPNYSTCASFSEGEHVKGLKRANCCSAYTSDMLLGNANCYCAQGMYFPEIRSKRKAVKALKPNLEDIRAPTSSQNYPTEAATTSKYFYSILAPHFNVRAEANSQSSSVPNHQAKTQFINWGDLNKLKRSKNSTDVRDLDTVKGFEECNKTSKSPGKERAKRKHKKNVKTLSTSCKEALPGEHNSKQEGRRKNGKKKSATTSLNAVNKHSPYLYYDQHFTGNAKGPFLALPWINTDSVSVDAIIEGMKQLNINREGPGVRLLEQNTHIPYYVQNQQTNALVLYQRDGVIIPFEGTQPSKRRPRAKVELDDETNRVWNLLLEDINNQGIDGTDEQKTKWWKEEREVFHGRVDSFIARMRLVQGDRRFSPWKGSVLDSVVGVFLTQNVSDHLSSSAYMSLAARYPLKSADKARRDPEEEISPSIREPEICIVDLDDSSDTLALNEKTVYTVEGPICDGNSSTLLDADIGEEKVVNSEESHGITNLEDNKLCLTHSSQGEPRESQNYRASNIKESEIASILLEDGAMDDGSSSQQSLISSQNSDESPSVPTSGKMGLSSDDSSEVKDLAKSFSPSSLHCSTTFVELLRMAETSLVHATNVPKEQVPSYQIHLADQEETVVYENPSQKASRSEMMDSFSNVHVEEEYILHGDEEIKTTTEASNTTAESAEEFHLQKEASETNLGPSSPVDNAGSCYVLEGENMIFRSLRHPLRAQQETINPLTEGSLSPQRNIKSPAISGENGVTESTCASSSTICDELTPPLPLSDHNHGSCEASKQDTVKQRTGKTPNRASYDWDSLRKQAQANGSGTRQRATNTMDSIDWEAVRFADVNEIADTIKERGMNNKLAERIKECLDRLVNDHGSIDLEWLRDVPPDKAKEYLLSIRGLGLKSVECVRLLTLHHLAFPVDTNVGRIAVRLGWVPLQPLPESLQLHLLELYPILESIQKYLWPRLCKLDQRTLYELHYHLITFGKVFCTKRQPNCNACPLRGECRHFASAFASARLALPGPQDKSIVLSGQSKPSHQDPQAITNTLPMPLPMPGQTIETKSDVGTCEPIVEIPASPEPEQIQTPEFDIEDGFSEDPNEIPTIRLNMEEFTQTLQAYMQSNKELQGDMSKALVALATEAASIPTPKLKNVSRLRTEHHVYELPDTHQLLRGMDKREPDDPCPYLLAIWTPGETANSIEPPEKRCSSKEPGELCSDETCFYCNSQREANSQIVRGTLLIPCRTAMRGRFPLNGTYFQVNEVFADNDSSLNPIHVPRDWLWNLPRRTVYFGTSIPTIFKGLSTEGIQQCFWRGYVCVRGFDQKTRAPRPLMARLHFSAFKMSKARGKK